MPVIVKVDGFDIDVRKESVLVEQHCASSVVGHVEPVREELVIDLFNRFLQGDDVPLFPSNVFFNGSSFSASRSSIPDIQGGSFD